MKRIVIVGCSGAGKTTVAKVLGYRLGLPVIHIDQIAFQPGWVQIDNASLDRKLTRIMAKKSWILEGNYGRTMAWRISKADTVIFLDYPRWICMLRVVKRVLSHYGKTRPDMADGCAEQFDWGFMKWVWNYAKQDRPKTLRKVEEGGKGKRILHLRSPMELDVFLSSLPVIETSKP